MTTTGGRERALFCQSLAPLIRGLEGRVVQVQLKNEAILRGTLVQVDCYMNLTMKDVTFKGGVYAFFFLQGKNLRYVTIPDDMNIKKTVKEQLDIVTGRKAKEERRKAKEKRANWLRKKEAKNMQDTNVAK